MTIARRPFLAGLGLAVTAPTLMNIPSMAIASAAAKDAPAEVMIPIQLLPPQIHGGKPVMEALSLRSSNRDFSGEDLPDQTLSDLLWAAFGINRPANGMRTAPSAVDWTEIDIYVVMRNGAFIYDAVANSLKPVVSGDFRADTGTQPFVKDAAVNLVYVANASRMTRPDFIPKPILDDAFRVKDYLNWADAAVIAENVYIFAASEGLSTVVRTLIDRPALAKTLILGSEQTVILAQSVGFPKKA